MMDLEQATAGARGAASATPADRLLERLAELIGAKAGVQAVFGEPIRQDVVTDVPVARIRWGFGGGGGRSEATPSGRASGSGGGGGVAADPVGYLEIGPDGAAFRAIRDRYPSPLFLIASGLTAALVIRAIVRLVRGGA